MRRALALLLLATALAAPAAAHATVSVSLNKTSHRLDITDVSGVSDVLIIAGSASTIRVESVQPLTIGSGCATISSSDGRFRAACTGADLQGLTVALGAGNDDWTDMHLQEFAEATPNANLVSGGLGNDVMRGSGDNDRMTGGDGDDQLFSGRGFDALSGDAGADSLTDEDPREVVTADSFGGGPGDDTIRIRGGGDAVAGDTGNDTIFEDDANEATDRIDGGPDADRWVLDRTAGVTIQDRETTANVFHDVPFRDGAELEQELAGIEAFGGTNRADVINAALSTGTTERAYNGRGGGDVVVGSDRGDRVTGGNGRDVMSAGPGNDSLDAKAGEGAAVPDEFIDCGSGTDSALIDLLDPNPVGCETVARSAIGEGPHVRIGTVRRVRGRARMRAVRLRCPRRLRHRCKGRLELALTRRGLGPARASRYSIRAGRA